MRRGPLMAGEKVQFTDRRSIKSPTSWCLVAKTSHGIILHDDVIGQLEGSVVVTVSAKRETQINQDHRNATPTSLEGHARHRWMAVRGNASAAGRLCAVDASRRADHIPKDIAQVIQLGDIRSGMNVLESGWIWRHEHRPAGRGE
ncbi:MAG: hypothetical protein ACLT4Y_12430 [Bifidobacterium breve]